MAEATTTITLEQNDVAMIAAAIAAEMEKHFTVEPTLTLAEAAEQLGVSQQVMRALCRDRKIASIRLDKSYRIKVIDLNRYLDKHYNGIEEE